MDEFDEELYAEMESLGEKPALVADETLPATVADYGDSLVQAKKMLAVFQAEAEALRNKVFGLAIKDKNGQAEVAELKAMAQSVIKKIDARVKELIKEPDIVTEWKAFCMAVKNFAANCEVPLKEAKGEADRKYSIFSEYERQERRKQEADALKATLKLQEQIDKQAQKKGIEPVVLPKPVAGPEKIITRTDSGTTYSKTSLEFTIENEDEVERGLCSPDLKKIKERVDGGARERELKGVYIFEKTVSITRTR